MTFEIGVSVVGWGFASLFAFLYLAALEKLDNCRKNKEQREGE
jgi:hypothetical protein